MNYYIVESWLMNGIEVIKHDSIEVYASGPFKAAQIVEVILNYGEGQIINKITQSFPQQT